MKALPARLRLLERRLQPRSQPPIIRLLYDDELSPCPEHSGCYQETATSVHFPKLVRLSFNGPLS